MLTFDLKQFRASHGLATSYYKTKASYFLLSSTNFHISIIYYKKKISFFFLSHCSLPSHNHSSLHVAPIYFSLLFSHGSNTKPSLWMKKKKNHGMAMLICGSRVLKMWKSYKYKNYHGICMDFLSKKKKNICSTNPKRKIIVATSHLSKPDGQVGVIVLW